MNLGKLKEIVDHTLENDPNAKECGVTIPVSGEYGFGPTPAVSIRNAYKGFDWDNGQFMMCAGEPLYRKNNNWEIKIVIKNLLAWEDFKDITYGSMPEVFYEDTKAFERLTGAKYSKELAEDLLKEMDKKVRLDVD